MSLISDRSKSIGGSEVAALLGLSPWGGRRSLFEKKAGVWKDDYWDKASLAMKVGVHLEPLIAEEFRNDQMLNKAQFVRAKDYWRHPTVGRYGCSGDYAIVDSAGNVEVPVEIKSVGEKRFVEHWPDDKPPVEYRLQVQAQIDCVGAERGYLYALIGNSRTRCYELKRNDSIIEIIHSHVNSFWESVDAGIPPASEWRLTQAELDVIDPGEVVPERGPERVPAGKFEISAMREYMDIKDRRDSADKELKEVKAKLMAMCEGKRGLESDEFSATVTEMPERVVQRSIAKAHSRLVVKRKRQS